MKKFLLAVVALACMGSVALAGPNAGGTLIVHNPSIPLGAGDPCLGAPLENCDLDVVRLDGTAPGAPMVWRVYAAFLPASAPSLQLVTWGITYDPSLIGVAAWGTCADYDDFASPTWPATGSGNSSGWNQGHAQTGILVPVYWFAGYSYGTPSLFQLGPNPDPVLGGFFYDSSLPPQLDPIACYGALGFDMDGIHCCPTTALPGACCIGDACIVVLQAACQGVFLGEGTVCAPTTCSPGACCDLQSCSITLELLCQPPMTWHIGVTCDPNPCLPPVPTEKSSWGQIKNSYR